MWINSDVQDVQLWHPGVHPPTKLCDICHGHSQRVIENKMDHNHKNLHT